MVCHLWQINEDNNNACHTQSELYGSLKQWGQNKLVKLNSLLNGHVYASVVLSYKTARKHCFNYGLMLVQKHLWHLSLLVCNVPSRLCTHTQVVTWAHTRKLGAHINFSLKCFLHTFHTWHFKYRWVLVNCCTQDIFCAHRLYKIRGNIARVVWKVCLCFCFKLCIKKNNLCLSLIVSFSKHEESVSASLIHPCKEYTAD